jgi:hypothetical protein
MPASKDDVLALLADPDLWRINFTVADIPVNAQEFRNVSDYFKNEDIKVIPGKTDGLAIYDREFNRLEADPASSSPLDDSDRALILHESVHAIVDIRGLQELSLEEEVAAYIAQLCFMQIKSPTPNHPPAVKIPRNHPLALFNMTVLDVIDQYKLVSAKGLGARISHFDVYNLSQRLHAVGQYSKVSLNARTDPKTSGVPIKGGGMRSLRAAIRNAHRPARAIDLLPWPVTNRNMF